MRKNGTTADGTRFTGFADSGARFFHALERNQNREWFLAHKHEYEEGWATPMRALLEEVREKAARSFASGIGEPKVFRIFRDVRFARDKSPYKTHVAGILPLAGRVGRMPGPVALYLHLGLDQYVGSGHWIMESAELARFREALLDPRRGGEVVGILGKLERAGFVVGSHETLKKVPRGVDPDHPRADLLKRKGLVVEFPKFAKRSIVTREFADTIAQSTKRAAPLVEWLVAATS
jgi:uncharacterized protein (TIGR02453 family)